MLYYLISVPVGTPRLLGSEKISAREIKISWSPLPESEKNGQLLGYKVRQPSNNIYINNHEGCIYILGMYILFTSLLNPCNIYRTPYGFIIFIECPQPNRHVYRIICILYIGVVLYLNQHNLYNNGLTTPEI